MPVKLKLAIAAWTVVGVHNAVTFPIRCYPGVALWVFVAVLALAVWY